MGTSLYLFMRFASSRSEPGSGLTPLYKSTSILGGSVTEDEAFYAYCKAVLILLAVYVSLTLALALILP